MHHETRILSAALLLLYATRAILIAYFTGHCQYNPQPAKLLLLAEAAKLTLTAVRLYAKFFSLRAPVAKSHHSRPHPGTAPAAATVAVPAAAALHITSLLKLTIPAFCYFCSNNLLFFSLELLPLHTYALLCNLRVVTTAAASSLLLQQSFSRQARWTLLLLLAAIVIGHCGSSTSSYAASSSSSSSSSGFGSASVLLGVQQQQQQRQQQQQVPAWIPSWARELLLMLAIAAFSAVGSVRSELMLSTAQQQQQPQAAQATSRAVQHAAGLYCWGVLLNGLWLWQGAAAAADDNTTHLGFLSDMRLVHWVMVGLLVALGLISGQVIRRQGSMQKAYIASLAMLPVAAVSHLVEQQQQQHPMLLYYVACCVAAAAVMHLQQQQQQKAGHTAEAKEVLSSSQAVSQQLLGTSTTSLLLSSITWLVGATSVRSSCGSGVGASAYHRQPVASAAAAAAAAAVATAGGQTRLGWVEKWAAVGGLSSEALVWLVGVTDRLAAAVVLLSVLLLFSGVLPSNSGSSSGVVYLQQASRDPYTTAAAAAARQAAMYNTTNIPMPQELISMPCIDGTWLQRDRFCPVFDCSLAGNCTVSDPSCCAHLNFQMLSYVDHLLSAEGLSQHYVIVYGTLLGAVRNKTILAHTNDVDVAMSAAAIAFLTQRLTQLELWRHGYVFWCSDNVWRLCAHRHHPLTAFQGLMRPGQQHTLQGGPYADVYLLWPSHAATAAAVDAAAAALRPVTPVAAAGRPEAAALQQQSQPHSRVHNTTQHSTGGLPRSRWMVWGGRRHEWQLCFSGESVRLSGRRKVSVEGLKLVVPDNSEQLLQGTYGPRWRTPNLRPYAPSYDEDECVEKVRALNRTLYGP